MKVYISGKITGLPLEEATALFKQHEMELHRMGHTPINPMKILPYHPDTTWEQYMLKDIEELFKCDAIMLMHNWRDSKGARIEHSIAKHIGLKIWYPGLKNSDKNCYYCNTKLERGDPEGICLECYKLWAPIRDTQY